MKLALANRPGHTGPFLALTDGYHGRSLASMGLGWPHTNHAFDRTFPAVLRVPQPYAYRSGRAPDEEVDYCLGELRDAIARRATGLPPALIMEPVQGNGTPARLSRPLLPRGPSGLRRARHPADLRRGADRASAGPGGCGPPSTTASPPTSSSSARASAAASRWPGVLASAALDGFQPGDDALTFGEFPVSLAAGLAALEVLERDGLLQACADMGKYATDGLRAMQPRHRLIGDIRGPGLLIGVELVRDRQTREPADRARPLEVYRRALDLGVIFGTTRYAGLGNVLKIKPPFTITRDQIDRVLDVLDQVLTAIESTI